MNERLISVLMTNNSSKKVSSLGSCSVVMMEESKLTNFQQRQLREKMQSEFFSGNTGICERPNFSLL